MTAAAILPPTALAEFSAATRLTNGFGDSCNFCRNPAAGHCTSCHALVCHSDLSTLPFAMFDTETALCPECVVEQFGICEMCTSGHVAHANCFECDRDLCLSCRVRCDQPDCAHIDYCRDCWDKQIEPCVSCERKRCQFVTMNRCSVCDEALCAACEQRCLAGIECIGDDYYCDACAIETLVACDMPDCDTLECVNCVHQCAGCGTLECVAHADVNFIYCDQDTNDPCLCNNHYCTRCYTEHMDELSEARGSQ